MPPWLVTTLAAIGGIPVLVAAAAWLARAWITQRLEQVSSELEATLKRVERLESDLLASRGEGYGKIWTLTGSLNLFGPTKAIDPQELSTELKEWYFAHGWLLTEAAADLYFLAQEVLNLALHRDLRFARPSSDDLYGQPGRTRAALQQLRFARLEIPKIGRSERYDSAAVAAVVDRWKETMTGGETRSEYRERADENWLLLQFCLSAFRSQLTTDLGSRAGVATLETDS